MSVRAGMLATAGRVIQRAGDTLAFIGQRVEQRANRNSAQRRLSQNAQPLKLHIGCGTIRFDGWVNIDALPTEAADVVLDVTHGIPAPDNSCKYVYNEHFLEHISVEDAVRLIAEVHRILQPGGVLRIAMPSIEVCVARYMRENWKEDEAIIRNGLTWLETKAEMLNVAFRNWGHQWLYDEEELRRRLLEGGFQDIAFFPAGDSGHEELRGRESRQESLLVCEATKR